METPLKILAILLGAGLGSAQAEDCLPTGEAVACHVVHGNGRHSCVLDDNGVSATGYVFQPCGDVACDAGFQLDDYNNCIPPYNRGCCMPGEGITLSCHILDLGSGEITVGQAIYGSICTQEQIAAASGGSPKSTDTAAAVNTSSQQHDSQAINDIAGSNSGSQSDARNGSRETVSLGANQAASSGALFCASAAITHETNQEQAQADAKSCDQSFAAANQMQALGEKLGKTGGFSPDPAVMDTEGAKSILDDFEKKFGVGRNEFVQRMLGGRGDPKVLEELTGGKLSAEKFRELAANAKAEPETVIPGAVSAAGHSATSALRAQLKKQLAGKREPRQAAAQEKIPMSLGRAVASESLHPLENAFAVTEELTLFEVVHRKYVEKARMLVPYRFP